jgi:hypothetical protein
MSLSGRARRELGHLTVNDVALVEVPAAVVTAMRPLLAPLGTVVRISVDVSEMLAAGTP